MKKNDAGQFQPHLKSRRRDSRGIRAVKIRYVVVPNANNAKERLSRTIAILLKAKMRNKKE